MTRSSHPKKVIGYAVAAGIFLILSTAKICHATPDPTGRSAALDYAGWASVGWKAAEAALTKMTSAGFTPLKGRLVAMTNAGFVEVDGSSAAAALDGLARGTEASRGRNNLLEIHSSSWTPLWFAVYDPSSGACVYLQVDPGTLKKAADPAALTHERLFDILELETVSARHIFEHADEFSRKFEHKLFGGNAFRIITVANAVAAGAPTAVLRAFEFHDHYCPGVTAGIYMVNYLKKHFPPDPATGYFVQALDPWCKDDALMVLLNATPGKRSYAASYPPRADDAGWSTKGPPASTLVYRQDGKTKRWQGVALAFEWAETGCRRFEDGLIRRLCDDLWYLQNLDRPEDFVKTVKTFELPEGKDPRSLAAPGVDAAQELGLAAKSEP